MRYVEMSQKAKEEVFKLYKTNENGLNQKEINDRLQKNGKNIASENKKRGWLYFFIQSFLWICVMTLYFKEEIILEMIMDFKPDICCIIIPPPGNTCRSDYYIIFWNIHQ